MLVRGEPRGELGPKELADVFSFGEGNCDDPLDWGGGRMGGSRLIGVVELGASSERGG